MIPLVVFVALAVLSTSAIVVACLRACGDKDDWILCLGSLTLGYFLFCAGGSAVAKGGVEITAWIAASALALNAAIFLGSVFRPLRPVWYFGMLMGARLNDKGTADYEENKAARKKNRRYVWATIGLFALFYVLLMPVVSSIVLTA
jgi:hypothetical protein